MLKTGLSQREIAEIAGVSQGRISQLIQTDGASQLSWDAGDRLVEHCKSKDIDIDKWMSSVVD